MVAIVIPSVAYGLILLLPIGALLACVLCYFNYCKKRPVVQTRVVSPPPTGGDSTVMTSSQDTAVTTAQYPQHNEDVFSSEVALSSYDASTMYTNPLPVG